MDFQQTNTVFDFSETHGMNTNFQHSSASGHLVDDNTRLRQRLEYVERVTAIKNKF